ncbi:MAG TPA: glycosyltransferase [Jatrophihabitans sp.]|nr:glycosyltransferase [Jatrophihabitans sp.]
MPVEELGRRLSLVLLTYNCAHRLAPVLDRVLALGVPVIAVDNGSTDATAELLADRPDVRLAPMGCGTR